MIISHIKNEQIFIILIIKLLIKLKIKNKYGKDRFKLKLRKIKKK